VEDAHINVTDQDNIRENIYIEQVKILYKNLLISVPANFICSLIVFIGLYQNKKNNLLWIWFGSVILISLFRLIILYFNFHRLKDNNFYLSLFISSVALSSAMWGIIGSILMPQSNLLEQMIVIVVIAGVTAGGIQTLNANLTASWIYISFSVLPLSIWLFMQQGKIYILLGIAMTTYLLFTLVTSVRGYKLIVKSLTLSYENLALIDNLSITNQKLLQSYKELEKHEQDIKIINKMNSMLQMCDGSKEAYDIILLSANELFVGLSGGLSILNTKINNFELMTQWGDKQSLKSECSIGDCWALRKGQAYPVINAASELICHHFNSPPHSSVCLPLINKSGIFGLLVLISQTKSLSSYQLQLATGFSEVIQLALTNIRLRESLYDQSIHDPLTTLFNRRYLDETLIREMHRADRDKKSLCVAMLDLDHFKIFNDTNGHEAGDVVLKFIGNTLRENFRKSDIACRFGGEEFLLVLVNSDLSAAYTRLEHIRETIKESKIYYDGNLLPSVTVSIGFAEAPMQGTTAEEIIRAADDALYLAKKAGRDRIMSSITCKQITN
jgi:diguanylate cyclase (GGDEF)-like protein